MKDKHAEKRYDYDLQIMEKERESEELHLQERQLKQSLENFEQDITRSFQTLTAIEDERENLLKERNDLAWD